MRFILNLKNLNKFIKTSHFKIEDLRTAVKLMSKNYFLATIDMKDAYFLINMNSTSRKYLRFIWGEKTYQFNVLPFGINTAPYIFTKLLKPVVKLLRSAGYLSTIYLDDILLIGRSYNECANNVNVTLNLLQALGFIINWEKSNLTPSTSCKFLGFIINTHTMQIGLPTDKQHRVKKELESFAKRSRCKIRRFAELIGLLISTCPAVEYGVLYTKEFERQKFLNLLPDNNFDKMMTLSPCLSNDFQWWLRAIKNPVHRIRDNNYSVEIFSDASKTGWGAACGDATASGPWSELERDLHINQLELLAAYFAVKIFTKHKTNCQILLRIDNSTAVSYINKMGGIQFPHLTHTAKQLWQWCESKRIFVFASYIKSSENSTADAESRKCHPDIEWELANCAFEKIVHKFDFPTVDLFASRINKKCDRYLSWFRDPDAFAIDAFTITWSDLYFYAFPPFAIVLKTLRKIIADKATGIMVVPLWPSQPWYPLFNSLLVSDVITFSPNERVIIFHSSSNRNIHSNLTLAAGILSGQHYYDEQYQNQL